MLNGKKYLITTYNWFFAPDGKEYKAVYGTLKKIMNRQEALGIETNRSSTNWYLEIGNMMISGCQIHYSIQCDKCYFTPPVLEIQHEGKSVPASAEISRIYFADI